MRLLGNKNLCAAERFIKLASEVNVQDSMGSCRSLQRGHFSKFSVPAETAERTPVIKASVLSESSASTTAAQS